LIWKSYRHGADGGDYDGCLGSISGLEIMEILKENIVTPSTWLIIFSDEEGSLLGSKALAEHLMVKMLKVNLDWL
jgi:N-carbamoyl-L-amino-acid hydrolase